MSLNSRINEMETHIGDIYDELEVGGADLTNVDKNIININPQLKDRMVYYLNNGLEEVWDNWEKTTGSGTQPTINNTEEAPMKLVYKGNTSQNGTPTPSSPIPVQVVSGDNSIEVCGKNLIDVNRETGYPSDTNFANTTKRIFDITKKVLGITANNYYGSNSYLSSLVVGTGQVTFKTIAGGYGLGYPLKLQIGETYTISANINDTVTNALRTSYYKEDGTFISYDLSSGTENHLTFTIPNETYYTLVIFTPKTDTLTTYSNIMLEKGTQATTYEPYTGASYPISLKNKNLLDIQAIVKGRLDNGVLGYASDTSALTLNEESLSFTTTVNYRGVVTDYIPVEYIAKHFLIISWENATQNIECACAYYDENKTFIRQSGAANITNGKRFGIDTNAKYIRIWISLNSAGTVTITKPQIEITSSQTQSDYVKHFEKELCKIGTYQDKIDKSTGKNLFDIDNLTFKNGYYNFSGTFNNANNNGTFEFINANPNTTYTFSVNNSMASIVVCEFNEAKTFITRTVIQNKTNATITTNSSTKYLAITINKDGTIAITKDLTKSYQPMLEKNNQTTSYEPYGTSWYLKKEIGKVVLNGSEAWVNLNYAYYSTVLNNLIKNIVTTDQSIYVMADHFKGESAYEAGTQGTTGIYSVNTQLYIRGYNSTYADINALKTFLSSNNTIVYYVLATPTYETITDTTLISQLEALKKSYEGQTNIFQTNNGLPFELDITALSK